jgi:hypothetical protein
VLGAGVEVRLPLAELVDAARIGGAVALVIGILHHQNQSETCNEKSGYANRNAGLNGLADTIID